jgi:sortase A
LKWLLTIERLLLLSGAVLIIIYAGVILYGWIGSHIELRRFRAIQQRERAALSSNHSERRQLLSPEVDVSLWSEKRIVAFEKSMSKQFPLPLAVLRVPKIHLEVPVLDGTDDLTLNRAVGRIIGTARPGERGHIGIAGHRDGFFRGLKDIAVGDVVELDTPSYTVPYVVDRVQIVNPNDVRVLEDKSVALTLVTCYPFYFVGDAPQRFIVQCLLKQDTEQSKIDAGRPIH